MEIWQDKSGEGYLAVSLVYETCLNEPGVDFGIVKLAVLSNNVFFDGREVAKRALG